MTFYSNTEKETFDIAKKLADKVKSGDVFLLEGNLGVGKSVFIRGLCRGLGITEAMPSPSFTLVNEYTGKFKIFHFDFYRLTDPFELYEIGFEDYVYSDGVSFIEWPSKGGDLIPEQATKISINIVDDQREIKIEWKK